MATPKRPRRRPAPSAAAAASVTAATHGVSNTVGMVAFVLLGPFTAPW